MTQTSTDKSLLTIAVFWPWKGLAGRSFIDAHTELLAGNKKLFYSPLFDPRHDLLDDREFFPKFLNEKILFSDWERFQQKLWAIFLKTSSNQIRNHFLAKVLKREKIEVILAEFAQTAVSILPAVEKSKIPLAVYFHGEDAYGAGFLKKYGKDYPRLFQTAKAIIVVSTEMKGQLERLGAPSDKIYINPCGADLAAFHGATPDKNPPVFVGAARFVEKKGHVVTLSAFQKVLTKCPEAKLVLIGDGPLMGACKLLCKILKISESVTFAGLLPPASVAEWMRKSRAFVQHSVVAMDNNSEGTPVSILEAGASGLPVVATRHMGITESVVHEKTGFLVEEGDVDGMAEYMIRLAKEPELAASLGKNAHDFIEKNYSLEKNLTALYDILVKICR